MTRAKFVMLFAGLGALVVASLSLLGGSGSAGYLPEPTSAALRPVPLPAYDGSATSLKHPTLSSHLIRLADAAQRAASEQTALAGAALPEELAAMVAADRLRISDDGLVQVYVEFDGTHDVASALGGAGADVERVADDLGIIQAWVPAVDLAQISVIPGVLRVRLPEYPHLNAGSVQTEGDAVMNADDVRSTFGVDGSGFSVGVISDGVGDLASAQGSGDLPAVDTVTCNTIGLPPGDAGSEGTAMLEIVHDVAPGADLMFGNFGFATSLDFNDAVNCLAANNDVVVDDIGWFGVGPYDGTSSVSMNTSDALNGAGPIRGYFTSVGNQADRHYQGDFVDSGINYDLLPDFWSLHSFSSGGSLGTKHDGQNADGSQFNRLIVAPGGSASVIIVWDDPWDASENDYDLFVFDGASIGCAGTDFQGTPPLGADPVEGCTVVNGGVTNTSYDIAIGNWMDSADPVEFDLFVLCDGCVTLPNLGNKLDFTTFNSSVANQGDAGGSPVGVISLGAVDHLDPGNDTVEFFSSIGPTNDGRMKPDVSAPDGVSTTTPGFTTFFGTSAAAPHAAGVAALLLDCNPSLGRQGLRDAILNNATDIEVPGPDQLSGTGHIDALASANAVACGAPTPTATNTSPGPTATFTETPAGATATPTVTATETPVVCSPDPFEDNDFDTDATVIVPPFGQAGLSVCEDDPDWYSIDLEVGEEIAVEALFVHGEGDIDIILFGPEGFVEASSLTIDDDEFLSYVADHPGKFLLLVEMFADLGTLPGNLYILSVTITDPIVYGDASCNDDVNAIDAAIVLQFSAFLITAITCDEEADVNLDGVANAIDAALILQFVAGLIPALPV